MAFGRKYTDVENICFDLNVLDSVLVCCLASSTDDFNN